MATTKEMTKSRTADAVGLNELLPCPFCGSKDVELFKVEEWIGCNRYPHITYGIGCNTAGCFLEKDEDMAWFSRKEDAIKAWNTRAR